MGCGGCGGCGPCYGALDLAPVFHAAHRAQARMLLGMAGIDSDTA